MHRLTFLVFRTTCLIFTGITATAFCCFPLGNLVIVNNSSAKSQGPDALVEFTPDGTMESILIPESDEITGMNRTVFDPLFYSISSWPKQIFEIREIDADGNLINTRTHPGINSGNTCRLLWQLKSMVQDRITVQIQYILK